MSATAAASYFTVTEQPGQAASRLQLEMMAARYAWAARYASGADVLEAACGSGTGLGILAAAARRVDAGDIDQANLEAARRTWADQPRIHLRHFDAMELPYENARFDVVLLFEAIYYLESPERFFAAAHRALRPGGYLLITTVNPEWSGFNPSPRHTRYLAASELAASLEACGFAVEVKAGFAEQDTLASRAIGLIRRAAVACGLVPRTMAGKRFLKRIFYGRLEPIPARLDPRRFSLSPPSPLPSGGLSRFRVLYAAARKPPDIRHARRRILA